MKTKFKVGMGILLILLASALTFFFISRHDITVLNPKGPIGIKEKELIITASLLMLIVVIPVFILTFFFAWKYREGHSKAKHMPDWEHNHVAEFCWWGVPLVIIIILAILTWKTSHELSPFKPLKTHRSPLSIQVVALNWKWLFIYPEEKIATLNFIQFPEKTPINFEITADAPMNSFWIPQLGGQIYAMPSMRTKLHLIANEVGVFRGSSANMSGKGFAGMTFMAKSTSKEDFDTWVQSVKESSSDLDLNVYNQLVRPSAYHPATSYLLMQEDLFDRIIMKYQTPSKD